MTNADARHLDNLEAQFLADDADVAAAVVVVVVVVVVVISDVVLSIAIAAVLLLLNYFPISASLP